MARTGHACRTTLEADVCREMDHQGLPHEHRSLRFRVRDSDGGTSRFAPAIVARRGSILFLVEPVASAGADRAIARLAAFLEQHSPEIVLTIVTPDASVAKVPPDAYDEIYAKSDLATMTARIRNQDPGGIARPFEKPRARGPSSRDTDE